MYLLKYGAPCRPDVIVRWNFVKMNFFEDAFFIASFHVFSSRETFVKENGWVGGGGYRRLSPELTRCRLSTPDNDDPSIAPVPEI